MKRKSQGSDALYQSLIHFYNLLDLLKLGYINNQLLRSVSASFIQLIFRSHNLVLINTISGMLLGIGYLLRCRSIVTQHQTTLNNSETLDSIGNESKQITIFDREYIYKQLASSRIDRIAQTFIFFMVNLGMFYITSYQIIGLLLSILTPLFPQLLYNTQISSFISLLCGVQIALLKTDEFYREQENTKWFSNLVTQQKITIQHPPQQHYIAWLSRLIAIVVAISAAFFILKSPWILYGSAAIVSVTCIGWMALNYKLISSHWLPYGTGLMSAISAYSSIKKIVLLHRHILPVSSDMLVEKCVERCGIALGLIYGYSIKRHETQHKCVETLLAIKPVTPAHKKSNSSFSQQTSK